MDAIRPASPDDLQFVTGCAQRAYAHYVSRIGQPPAPMVANFNQLIASEHVHILQSPDKDPVGYIVLFDQRDCIFVENIAIDPACQGHGYGHTLMKFAEDHALAGGVKTLRLYTNIHMHENIPFYLSLGFRETDRRRENGFDRVYFEKTL